MENILSFSFLGVRFHHWTGMYPLVEDTKSHLEEATSTSTAEGDRG